MNYKFLIKHDEQIFKDQYYKVKKNVDYIALFNFSYYLINENYNIEIKYLLFSLEEHKCKSYNNILYAVSNKFGDFVYKEQNRALDNRYLMLIKDNYYIYYHLFNDYNPKYKEIVCRIVYLDDNILYYDDDNISWDTLTAKKIEGLIPIDAIKEVEYKLPIFINTINSLRFINEL